MLFPDIKITELTFDKIKLNFLIAASIALRYKEILQI